MTITKPSNDAERRFIINLVTDDRFCKEIIPLINKKYFSSVYAREISSWCIEYYEQFSRAPKKDLQDIYYSKKSSIEDEETVDLLKKFLSSISKEYSESNINNIDYEIKNAVKFLKLRSLELLKNSITDSIEDKEPIKGEAALANFKRVEKPLGQGVSLLHDSQKVIDAFMDEDEVMFQFPGALGQVAGKMCRGDFVSFLAPMKRGKCLTGDSIIVLSNGELKRLDAIIGNQEGKVLSFSESELKFKPKTINDFYTNGEKKVYKIITKTGREVKITKNHPLLTFENSWKSIYSGLQIGNHIAVPKNISIFGNSYMPIDHVRLLAYLLADGGLTDSSPTYTKKDSILKNDFIRIIESLGDKVHKPEALTCSVVKGYHGPQPTEMMKLCRKYKLHMVKSIEKTIPDIIFTLNEILIREFLKILFSGDGSITKNGIEYSTGNEIFARQVQHLLLRFGIVSLLRGKIAKINNRVYYTVSIRDTEYIVKYITTIGFFGIKEEKQNKLLPYFINKRQRSYLDIIPGSYRKRLITKINELGIKNKVFNSITEVPNTISNITKNYLVKVNEVLQDEEVNTLLNADIMWDEITNIEYAGKEKTYDLTINKYHNFIANDICVHNTWYLWYVAETALYHHHKVIFFTLEMTENQIIKRSWRSLVGQPKYKGNILIPYFEKEGDKYIIETKEEEREGLDPSKVEELQKRFRRKFRKGDVRIISLPTKSASVSDLNVHLDNMEYYENFIPDVIIIDYADILIAEKSFKGEYRHQLDNIWSSLRKMAQERNCLVVTASQTEKGTFKKDVDEASAAEDIRKIAHITSGLALNQTREEKKRGILRISQVVAREEPGAFDQAVVLQCLDIGRPCIDSRLKNDVELNKVDNDEDDDEKETKSYKRK